MRRALVAALAAALLATGCTSGDGERAGAPSGPGRSDIDVDTPELRRLKEQAGIEPCRPGGAASSALPDLTLPCLGGGPSVNLATLTGPMVVNLWYAGCKPCEKEMPALQAFHERYGEQVRVLGVDYQDIYPGVALELARETGATYPQLADPGGDLNGREPFPIMRGAPYLGFVDESGRIVHSKFGGIESVDELVELVREHLGVTL